MKPYRLRQNAKKFLHTDDGDDANTTPAGDQATKQSFTWSTNYEAEFNLIGYTIQSWLMRNAENWLIFNSKRSATVHYGTNPEDNVMMCGVASFVIGGQLCGYEADWQNETHRVFSDHNIDGVIQQLQHLIKHQNPARHKYLQFCNRRGDFYFTAREVPTVSLDDVIVAPKMLEDIVDNTLNHLEFVDGANGIIFHGIPGTGKSLAAQAIVAAAMQKGYCAAFMSGRVDFESLDRFVANYLSPGILILEDIDTFTESREGHQQHGFSDFLQFMSGLFERHQKTVVIATTNHLKFLDDAVAARPVRFNRRYEFGLPKEPELRRLFHRLFPNIELSDARLQGFLNNQFSGSHFAEIKRTAEILSAKYKKHTADVLTEAIQIVGGEFKVKNHNSGF